MFYINKQHTLAKRVPIVLISGTKCVKAATAKKKKKKTQPHGWLIAITIITLSTVAPVMNPITNPVFFEAQFKLFFLTLSRTNLMPWLCIF